MSSQIDEVRRAYLEAGTVRGAARLLNWSRKKVRYWMEKLEAAGLAADEETIEISDESRRVKTLDELLRQSQVDTNQWTVLDYTVNSWEAITTDGNPETLYQVKAHLGKVNPLDSAEYKKPQFTKMAKCSSRLSRDICLVIPDTQHGFTRDPITGQVTPFHDEAAWHCMLESAKQIQPNVVVLLGDNLDMNEWSKYSISPAHTHTTQMALQALHDDLSDLRAAVGEDCKIIMLEGNHEKRLQTSLQDRIPQLCAVAGTGSDNTPIVSVAKLLQLDKLGIEYVGPYGAEYWLWDEVKIHHGDVVRAKGGATVTTVLGNAHYSEVFGHIHRAEIAFKTIHGARDTREIFAMSPGTLSRIDGVVPPGRKPNNWQQGFAYITRDFQGVIWPSLVRVRNGRYFH